MDPNRVGIRKNRVLFLARYMLENTDDDHIISTQELLDIYHANGYELQRTWVKSDMDTLREAGLDIIEEWRPIEKGRVKCYHVGATLFELSELRVLADAVASSRFISAAKSDALIEKLSQLTSVHNRPSLKTQIYNEDRLKTSNPNVFISMDVIRSAIDSHHKISFQYWDYTPQKKRVLRHDGGLYIASPYALIWGHDRYYAAAWSDSRDKLIRYRVDRMCNVRMLDDPARIDDSFNAALHSRTVIKMFDGDLPEKNVTLLCTNDMMIHVLDRFGEETRTKVADPTHFRAVVKVVPSSTFFGWLFQYQGKIIIERPMEVRNTYVSELEKMLSIHLVEL